MFCRNCGKEIDDNAVICVNCGHAVNNAPAVAAVEDKVSVGLVILAILIPLFGFIYWPVKSGQTPKRARACGIAAIISFVVSFLFSVIITPIFFKIMSGLLYDWYI
ncbi:MAG: zinc ribbon domain-containing protein [Clostridia bacterium]|nr:zinc ribbon domain-containing protein [Clostridia bacterium]